MSHALPAAGQSRSRPWLLGAALLSAVLVLAVQQTRSAGLAGIPLFDFPEYWAAGRLNLHGENPYDHEAVRRLEREVEANADTILMWNPPWTLPFVMPLGLLECRTARLLWLALHFLILTLGADVLFRAYGGPAERRWLAWVVALLFLPSIIALTTGQISPLVLLGAVGFLHFSERRQDALAGAAAVLLAIKPHLSYLFWIALLLWAVRGRRWSVLAGGVLAGLLATAVALWCNPHVLGQYWHTFTHHPPAEYRSPTLGTTLRLALGEGGFRLQFLALLPGLAWFVPYWLRHRRDWSWPEQMPALLLVSVLTAAYGAWPFDLVLLLVPVLQRVAAEAAHPRWPAAAVFTAINAVALAQVIAGAEYLWFIWMTPALLLAYVALRPPSRRPTPSPLT